jgi:hypothetical protein
MEVKTPEQRKPFESVLLVCFLSSIVSLNPWIRGDGVGYYAFARAPLIEHSFDFTHDYQSANPRYLSERLDLNGQPKEIFRTRTGHLDNHFAIGPAILWSPFLLLAHSFVLAARCFGVRIAADGFSAPYRYLTAFATALYGFLALLLSFRIAKKYVEAKWAFLAAVTTWGATSLPVYMYFNPFWSHAHSAFAVALFVYYWEKTRSDRSFIQWIILAVVAGLMLNVYYPNIVLLLVLIVEDAYKCREHLKAGIKDFTPAKKLIVYQFSFVIVAFLSLSPTFASKYVIYGDIFETGYVPLKSWLWTSPQFSNVLFSSNHGLFLWTPIVIFSLVGLLLFAVDLHEIGVALLSVTIAFYLLICFYPDWTGISSFGNRFFISLTPLFVIGLANLFQRMSPHFSSARLATLIFVLFCATFVMWNCGLMLQWGMHLIPVRGPVSVIEAAYNQFFVVPKEVSGVMRNYMWKRKNLMIEIERRDIEQLKRNGYE